MPIAEPPLVSNDSRLSAPSVSGSWAFRSATGIGVPPPAPVSAPIMSPSAATPAAPADAGSPDFCAASMRSRAASMRLEAAAIASPSTLTSPSGVLKLKAPLERLPAPNMPTPANATEIAPMTTPATMPMMITTAV